VSVTPNQFRRAEDITAPGELREGRWHAFEPAPPVTRVLRGRPFQLRPGLTFTPYANPVACNAHCSFCSEELLRHDAERLTAKLIIPDRDAWFDALDAAWRELAGFPMGLSLSGLEATAHPEWMLRLLSLLRRHDALFPLRVLYTNGSGLFADQRLITGLVESRFDRVELSRCHFDERVNHRVMRFDQGVGVRARAAFDETVRRVLAAGLTLKLVCILNTQATSTLDDVERYLDAAEGLGVKQVVFRSLSELGDRYVESRETRWIQRHRAPTRPDRKSVV
jgi:MoaA/NifB/PqqE/SkfB family radical SAM enzyme